MIDIKKVRKSIPVIFIALFTVTLFFNTTSINAAVSQTPPMGWNSYDCFNFSVTEAEVKANADYMAANLKAYGWQYICVDWCWSFPGMGSQATPNQDASYNPRLNMDSYGRVLPDPIRHPSSVNGQGFKPLADYVHSKGLKFGIHIMRGIPRQAWADNTPILGTSYRAKDIADTVNVCTWLNHMYGLNMSHAGSQAYLNSLFQLYASWGVDYVKVDDLINPYGSPAYRQSEIVGYRNAITNCGREMVFSTSPGATPLSNASHISQYANQWRMANDLWDNWSNLNAMFDLAAQWYPYAGPGHWPDADMIPIGRVSKRGPNGSERWSNLTTDEKRTMMTLWSICRSPLIWGGNLVENRAEELALMTNIAVIAVNQNSANNRQVSGGTYPVWTADVPGTNNKYLGLFNRGSSASNVSVNLSNIGLSGSCAFTDLWTNTSAGTYSGTFTASVNAHGTKLYRVVPTSSNPTPTPGTANSYEAESPNNTLAGTAVVANVAGASGGQVVGYVGNGAANTLQFNGVNVATSGTYSLTIHYITGENRTAGMSVNGGTATTVSFPSTGSWTTVGTVTVSVSFNAGNNTIKFSNASAYAPDFDRIVISGGTSTPTPTGRTSTPTPTPIGATYYKLQNRATNLYIDGMGRTSNGSNCGQWSSSSSYNQQWIIETVGNYVKLKNRATGLYLDGMGRTSNGSACAQYSSSTSYNQQWTRVTVGSYVKLKNRATGLCIDGMGRTSNGSDLGQYADGSSTNQQWALVQP